VEREAVNDVREGIPVGDVLRVLGTGHHAVQHLDVAALADGNAAHRKENPRGDDRHGKRGPDVCGPEVAEAPDPADRPDITQVLEWKPGHACRDYRRASVAPCCVPTKVTTDGPVVRSVMGRTRKRKIS